MDKVGRHSTGDDIPSDRFALRCESVGIRWVCLPIRALSAGRLAGLGARPTLSTGCWQPVDKAGRQLIGDDIPSDRFALRCESVGIRWVCLPIRVLSAGRLAGLGARPTLSTGCWQPVDKAGRQLIGEDIPSDRFALRCESVGIRRVCLPIRALSAGRLAGLGARPTLSTGCWQPVDKAGRQLIGEDIPSDRFALRCESVGIRWVCLPIRALSAGCLAGLGARPTFIHGLLAARGQSRTAVDRRRHPV